MFSLSDLYCDYLTDSVNFRVFIDTYQDYEDILYECKGNSIFVKKVDREDNKKVVFKTYDKLFEIKNKRGIIRTDVNILRIESELRKVEKTYLLDFFTDTNLTKVQTIFFNKWDKLNFDFNIDAPKGTHKSKIELAKELMRYGIEPTRKKYNNLLKENAITIKIHRSIESFINNWNTNKYSYKIQNTLIYTIWAKCYSTEKQANTQKCSYV